jgi:cytochrome oxidase assembly protein ShyY1
VLALLRTSRWLGFTALVIVSIIGFGILSYWQWTRAEDKRLERLRLADLSTEAPTDPAQANRAWQSVALVGRFDDTTTRVVRQRPIQGRNGVWIITLMRLDDGRDVWVNRGWMPAGMSASDVPQPPPASEGTVELRGAWVPYEIGVPQIDGLPRGMVAGVAAEVLPVRASLDGFIHAQDPTEEGLYAIPPPQVSEGQNLSYALQWLAFAFVAMGGWWFMLRREASPQEN